MKTEYEATDDNNGNPISNSKLGWTSQKINRLIIKISTYPKEDHCYGSDTLLYYIECTDLLSHASYLYVLVFLYLIIQSVFLSLFPLRTTFLLVLELLPCRPWQLKQITECECCQDNFSRKRSWLREACFRGITETKTRFANMSRISLLNP